MTYYELQKCTPIEERRYYVYMFFEEIGGKLTPFYVGKGTGNRVNTRSNRSRTLTEYMRGKTIKQFICAKALCEEFALELEKRLKEELVSQGFKLVDGEHNREERKRRQMEGLAAMPVVDGKKVSVKTGRPIGNPGKRVDGFEKFLAKNKKGEMTAVECSRELGISRTQWYRLCKEVSAS